MARRPLYPNAKLQESFISSLGSFINNYSSVEAMVRSLMSHIAGVDEPTALALFSGIKTDQAITNIRRLHTARNVPLHPALDLALQQLAIINGFRNDVLHHRVNFQAEPPVTTNRGAVIKESAVRETEITSNTLDHAEEDIAAIILIFSVFLSEAVHYADLSWVNAGTWKHKPASQPRKRSQRSQGRRGPKPPPQS